MVTACPPEKELIPYITSSNNVICPACEREGGELEVAHGAHCGFILNYFGRDMPEAYSFINNYGKVCHRGSSYTPGHPLFKEYFHHQKGVIGMIIPTDELPS